VYGHRKRQAAGQAWNLRITSAKRRIDTSGLTDADELTANTTMITFSLFVPNRANYAFELAVEFETDESERSFPVNEGDQVWVDGIWKPRTSTLTARRIVNRTQGSYLASSAATTTRMSSRIERSHKSD
jgi:hypothetical protein